MRFLIISLLILVSVQASPIFDKAETVLKPWENVWPGLDYSASPTILVAPDGIAAYHWKGPKAGWTTKSGFLTRKDDPWSLRQIAMNPNLQIEDQKAFVFNINHENLLFPLVHEKFHNFQFDNFKQNEALPKGYEDQYNAENLALMNLEERALSVFLRGDRSLEAIKNYASIRSLRITHISRASNDWENHQERMEGIADYVAARIMNRPIRLIETNPETFIELATKWRYYSTGASVAMMLDYAQVPGWKKQVEEGESLFDLLVKKLNMTEKEVKERAARQIALHDYEKIKQGMSHAILSYQNRLNNYLSSYKNDGGITFHLNCPTEVSGGGHAEKILVLDEGKTLTIHDSSVSETKEKDWVFETNELSHVFSYEGEKEFKAEEDLEIIVDNKPLRLGDIFNFEGDIAFSNLIWEGKKTAFTAKDKPGSIHIEKGEVFIRFNTDSSHR